MTRGDVAFWLLIASAVGAVGFLLASINACDDACQARGFAHSASYPDRCVCLEGTVLP